MNKLFIFTVCFLLAGCATLVRPDTVTQHITVKNWNTREVMPNVPVKVNDKLIGTTNALGIVSHKVNNPDRPSSFMLSIDASPEYYKNTESINSTGFNFYVFGDATLLLLGIVPGVIALGVDFYTGEWSTYTKELEVFVTPL